ncbi:MAG: trigger factor [Bacteroidales bacterium]|nr:trigger factor [Bacteroidales bacterium]
MNITLQNTDELNAVITVNIQKEDVAENVEKALKEYRRKAQVPGFRPGMVPMGLIKKMYGDSLMVEAINKKISEGLNDYLTTENLNILGDPLPSENQETIDFDETDNYNFAFDIALAPEFELKLTKREKIMYYLIDVNDEMVDKHIDQYRQRFGEFNEAEAASEESLLRGLLIEADEDMNPKEDGVQKEDASIYIGSVKDEEIKTQLINVKLGESIGFNLKKALPNDAELSSLLDIDKDKLENISENFRFSVELIRDFKHAELNEELFEKITQNPEIKTEEDFRNYMKEEIQNSLVNESEYRFKLDAKEKLLKKLNLNLPEEFLKRWLLYVNKELDQEQLNSYFDSFADDLRWTLITNKLLKENEVEITQEDAIEQAKIEMMYQFRQYGMSNVPDDVLEKYATEMLQKENDAKRILEQVGERKALEIIKEAVKIEESLVSVEEFDKLFAKN